MSRGKTSQAPPDSEHHFPMSPSPGFNTETLFFLCASVHRKWRGLRPERLERGSPPWARAPSSVWSTAFLTACQGWLEITERMPLSDARISPPAFPTRALRLTLSLFRGFRKRRTKTPPPGTGMEPQPDQPSRYVFKVPGSQKHQKMDTSVLVTASLRLEPIA